MTSSEAFVETPVCEEIKFAYGIVGQVYEDPLDMFPDAGIRFIVKKERHLSTHMLASLKNTNQLNRSKVFCSSLYSSA